jgi:hypothetical protein
MVVEQKQNQDNFKHANSWVMSFHGMIMPLFHQVAEKGCCHYLWNDNATVSPSC